MLEYISVFIGTFVILFIIIIALLIFAPKSKNFFDVEGYYPKIHQLSKNNEIIDKTFIRLGILNILNEDSMSEDYEKYDLYNEFKDKEIKLDWKDCPDKDIIQGDVKILPIYMFSKLYSENINLFPELYNNVKLLSNIKSLYFIKVGKNSKILEHQGWKNISNDTLKYIYCFNSFCFYETDCGIWVNGEIKKLYKDLFYVFDSSKSHSIFNNTYDDVYLLCIDLDRPQSISKGISSYECKNMKL